MQSRPESVTSDNVHAELHSLYSNNCNLKYTLINIFRDQVIFKKVHLMHPRKARQNCPTLRQLCFREVNINLTVNYRLQSGKQSEKRGVENQEKLHFCYFRIHSVKRIRQWERFQFFQSPGMIFKYLTFQVTPQYNYIVLQGNKSSKRPTYSYVNSFSWSSRRLVADLFIDITRYMKMKNTIAFVVLTPNSVWH